MITVAITIYRPEELVTVFDTRIGIRRYRCMCNPHALILDLAMPQYYINDIGGCPEPQPAANQFADSLLEDKNKKGGFGRLLLLWVVSRRYCLFLNSA